MGSPIWVIFLFLLSHWDSGGLYLFEDKSRRSEEFKRSGGSMRWSISRSIISYKGSDLSITYM